MKLLTHRLTQKIRSLFGNTTPDAFKNSAGSKEILLDLGVQPLANALFKTRVEALEAKQYDLLALYDKNYLIHLWNDVSPKVLYKDYLYCSGVSKPYQKHCEEMFKSLDHLNHEVIIDIGGNDGTLLKTFKRCEIQTANRPWCARQTKRYINVDASKSFKKTNLEAGIEYVNAFFSDDLKLPKANLITSTNVFQHTKDVHKFLRGIKKCLDGIWILEFPYTLHTLKTLQFDQFYHEHYYYWLVTPLVKLLDQYDLKVIHHKHLDIHGGSLRLWITNKEPSAPTDKLEKLLKEEEEFDYEGFDLDVKEKIHKDFRYIQHLEGRTAFFGAAAKGTVYLNALGLDCFSVPGGYVVDDTPGKQNKFIAGTGFCIKDREFLYEDQPDNLIILAHNFKDFIESSLRPHYRGRIITMLPTLEVKEFYNGN